MNREIKFRLCIKKHNEIYYNPLIDFQENIIYSEMPVDNSVGFYFDEKDFELMQYTGLKDIKGKEIYEGDLVKSLLYNDGEINKVIWEDALSIYPFQYYMQSEDFEIIGNIYENPELLV